MSPKRRHEEDEEMLDDDEREKAVDEDEDEDDDDDDEDTIALDEAEEEEDDDDDVDDDDDEDEKKTAESVEDIERKRLFQIEAEEILENMTLDDVKEVLKEYELEVGLASRLKKLLVEVINEGDVDSMDDAWDEAVERLED